MPGADREDGDGDGENEGCFDNCVQEGREIVDHEMLSIYNQPLFADSDLVTMRS